MKNGWHIAQVNIARAIAPINDPSLADFTAQIDGMNELAEASPGFVWRHKAADGTSSSYMEPAYDDPRILFNLSVWESVESLEQYAYRSMHKEVFAARRKWFEKMEEASFALWWVRAGHVPSVAEAKSKLQVLQDKGPSAEAFTFRQRFPAPAA